MTMAKVQRCPDGKAEFQYKVEVKFLGEIDADKISRDSGAYYVDIADSYGKLPRNKMPGQIHPSNKQPQSKEKSPQARQKRSPMRRVTDKPKQPLPVTTKEHYQQLILKFQEERRQLEEEGSAFKFRIEKPIETSAVNQDQIISLTNQLAQKDSHLFAFREASARQDSMIEQMRGKLQLAEEQCIQLMDQSKRCDQLGISMKRMQVREELYKGEIVRLTQALARSMKDKSQTEQHLLSQEKRIKLESSTFKQLQSKEIQTLHQELIVLKQELKQSTEDRKDYQAKSKGFIQRGEELQRAVVNKNNRIRTLQEQLRSFQHAKLDHQAIHAETQAKMQSKVESLTGMVSSLQSENMALKDHIIQLQGREERAYSMLAGIEQAATNTSSANIEWISRRIIDKFNTSQEQNRFSSLNISKLVDEIMLALRCYGEPSQSVQEGMAYKLQQIRDRTNQLVRREQQLRRESDWLREQNSRLNGLLEDCQKRQPKLQEELVEARWQHRESQLAFERMVRQFEKQLQYCMKVNKELLLERKVQKEWQSHSEGNEHEYVGAGQNRREELKRRLETSRREKQELLKERARLDLNLSQKT